MLGRVEGAEGRHCGAEKGRRRKKLEGAHADTVRLYRFLLCIDDRYASGRGRVEGRIAYHHASWLSRPVLRGVPYVWAVVMRSEGPSCSKFGDGGVPSDACETPGTDQHALAVYSRCFLQ